MAELINKGFGLKQGNIETVLPDRVLTPTELNYKEKLKDMGILNGFDFPHKIYETVVSLRDKTRYRDFDFFRCLSRDYPYIVSSMKKNISNQKGRITTHSIQITKDMKPISPHLNDLYVKAQIEADYHAVNILDENRAGDSTILEEAIMRNIDKIIEIDKTPRVVIDPCIDDYYHFENKISTTLDQGIKAVSMPYRSIPENIDKYLLIKELSQKGNLWIHMFLCPRFQGGKKTPVSLPSLLSSFGIKTFSLRQYKAFDNVMSYDKIKLFDEPTLGMLNKEEQYERYGSDFVFDAPFTPFDDKDRDLIYELCEEREVHQPFYAYETTASKHELNTSSKYIRSKNFGKYVEQKQYLEAALDGLGVPY